MQAVDHGKRLGLVTGWEENAGLSTTVFYGIIQALAALFLAEEAFLSGS